QARGGGEPTLGLQQGHGPEPQVQRDPFGRRKEANRPFNQGCRFLTSPALCAQPSSSRTMHAYRSSAEPKEDPAVLRLPDLKLRKEKRCRLPQESMTTLTEMTLSALAWLVAFAVRYGLSPAVPEMPSVGSGKAEGKRIRSCSTRPHLRAMTSMLPSLRLRGVAPACKYLLCDTAVHLHLLRAERRSWPPQPEHTIELQY
ncbi:hypothetical protein EDB85DRAFT_1990571, partial [Lactarius pseudohatsudake]